MSDVRLCRHCVEAFRGDVCQRCGRHARPRTEERIAQSIPVVTEPPKQSKAARKKEKPSLHADSDLKPIDLSLLTQRDLFGD